MAGGELERFAGGETSEWRADVEHMRDISVALRFAMVYSMQNDLEGYTNWFHSLESLARMLLPYCDEQEKETINKARALRPPSVRDVRALRIYVDLGHWHDVLGKWEVVLREIVVKKGFGIRARAGDESWEDFDEEEFKRKSGLA